MAEAQLVASVVLQELLEELVPPRCETDDELEFIAYLLPETKRAPATRITGYSENVVPNLLDSKFKKNANEKKYVSVALIVYVDQFSCDCPRDYAQIIMMQRMNTDAC